MQNAVYASTANTTHGMLASDETELAAITLEEEVTATASTQEEETNELMDSVISDRHASDSDCDVEHDKVKKRLGYYVIDACSRR